MNVIRYAFAVAWKELQILAKDPATIGIFFLLPLLLSSVQGAANITLTKEEGPAILLHVGLVNEDGGNFGSEIAKAIQSISILEVETFDSIADAEEQVAKGDAAAAIRIPADFSQNINDYLPTTIGIVVDPAQPQSTSIISGIMNQVVAEVTIWGEVQHGIRDILERSGLLKDATPELRQGFEAQNLGVIMTRINEMRKNPAITILSKNMEGGATKGWLQAYLGYIFAAFIVMFVFFVVGSCAESILAEREIGTLRRLVAAPIPRGAVIAGKMLAFMVIPCLQAVVMFGVANLFFDVPLGQSPEALVVLTLVVAAVATAFGMLLATLVKSAKQAADTGVVLGMVLAAVGGALPLTAVPIARMGGVVSILSRLTPHAHAVEGYYKVVSENATLVDILPEIGILIGMGLLFFLIAMRRFKYQ